MKKIYIIYSLIFVCYFLSSCTTSQKIVVKGTPGTEIYSPAMERLAIVESNGRTKIKLSSDGYYAYLMSHQPNTNQFVPFALDYEHKSYIGTQVLKGTGYAITAAGLFAELVGLAALGGGADEVGTPFFVGGAAALGLGVAIGMPADFRSNQTQYEHKFKYMTYNVTNQDIHFTQIVDNGYNKNMGSDGSENTNKTPIVKENIDMGETSVARRKNSVSTKVINDFGRLIAGTYIGRGSLLQNDNIVEKYEKINITVKRINKNTVSVDVFENGDAFFSSKTEYSIKKDVDKYLMSLKGIPSAVISIDAQGNLVYYHPKVNIDGEIYTLEINAKKQKLTQK